MNVENFNQIDIKLKKQGYLPLETFEITPDINFNVDIFGIPSSVSNDNEILIKKLVKKEIAINHSIFDRMNNWKLYVNNEGFNQLNKFFKSSNIYKAPIQENAFSEKTISDGLRLQDIVFNSILKDNILSKSAFSDVIDFVTTESENINEKNLHNLSFNLIKDIEGYDRETHIHSLNVSLTALYWAEQVSQNHTLLSWVDRELDGEYQKIKNHKRNKDFIIDIAVGAFLHDLGKLDIPKDIIKKQTRLSDDEFMKIKEHPENGFKRTRHLPLSKRIRQIILFHHVKYKPGPKSYPDLNMNPSELGILRPANFVSICDVLEALLSKRAYKNNWTPKNAIIHIWNRKELDFYPELVEAFVKLCSKNIIGSFFYDKGDYAWIAEYNSQKKIQSLSLAEIINENMDVPSKPIVKILGNALNAETESLKINKRLPERDLSKEPRAEMLTLLTSDEKNKMQNQGFISIIN
ncbi:MAG: HD domain-containing protein [Spirochaetia bacterium]|nr:HD domain-containing protein [Spirochaetia bacterium]